MNPETLIEKHPIFSSLSQKALHAVMAAATQREIEKGNFLAHQGDVWPYLFLVEKGMIAAKKDSADGRAFVAATFGINELFWGIAFFLEEQPTPAAFEAIEQTKVLLWSRSILLPILESEGKFSWELGKLAVQRMILASEIVESMTFHPIAVRLARLLMDISKNESQNHIERNMTLDEMAARIGSTREMVCRLLYKFSDEGLIKITRTDFTILDGKSLNQRAQKSI